MMVNFGKCINKHRAKGIAITTFSIPEYILFSSFMPRVISN